MLSQRDKKQNFWGFWLVNFLFLAISWLIALGMYNILRLGPNFHLLTLRTKDYVYPISHLWERPLDPFMPYMDRAFRWIWQMGIGLIYLLIGFSIFKFKKYRKETLFLLFWFLAPLMVVAMFSKTFTVRYILYTLPFLFSLGGLGFGIESVKVRNVFLGVLLFYIVLALRFNYVLATEPIKANLPRSERSGYLEEWSAGTGIYEASEYVRNYAAENSDKNIVVGTEGYFGTLPDGMQMYLEGVLNVTIIGIGRNISGVPQELVDSRAAGSETFLMANSSRLTDEFDFSEVEIIMSFEKAHRATDTHEYANHGLFDTFYLMRVL